MRELWSIEAIKSALDVSRFEIAAELMVSFRAYGREEYVVTTQSQIESWLIRFPVDELSRELSKLNAQAARPVVDDGMRQARAFMLETVRDRLAIVALERKDTTLARRLLQSASPRFKRSETGELLRRLSDLAEPPVQSLQTAVGVLLEMQDDFASRRSAEIITGAMRALDEEHSTLPVRLLSREIRDTSDSAIESGLLALVRDGAAIIIAGVTSATTRVAATMASSRQAVVITLSGESADATTFPYWFRVEEVTQVIERTIAKPRDGGPLRLTMQDAFCTSTNSTEPWPVALTSRREVLLLTDEDCAKKAAMQLAVAKTNASVWLGPEAVGVVDRFSDVSLVTSPRLANVSPSPVVQQWQERFRRMPFWYEALGYDVVQLSNLAIRSTATETVTSADAIARERNEIATALGRVQAPLLTSSAAGFDRKQRLVPSVTRVAVATGSREKSAQ